ncbi:lamin tail domain-containing protein [Nocardioides sp. L-11A]|uniref:lamin tail domain-containing protein n=1 Tax=Nocardioides sp. L-11A TaxID=3043848 RepID=UPI00249B5426|nr:lamin tail domain-containing protein [Nocardioides sp. L-11A]
MTSPSRAVAVAAAGALGLSGLSFFAVAAPASAADPAGALGAVVINEFSTNGWNDNTDFIELHNKSAANVDLTGYHLTDDKGIAGGDDIVLDGVLPAGGFAVILNDDPSYPNGFGLGKSDEVHLLSPDQATVIDAYVDLPADTHAAPSYARTTDGTGSFAQTSAATPGGSNALSAADAGVSISEYLSDGTDFVEIRNNGLAPVDLTGWTLADGEGTMNVGDEITLGGAGAVVPPGGYLVVETEPAVPVDGFTYAGGGYGLNKNDHLYLTNDEGALVDTTWVGYEADGVTTRHASPSWARTAPGVGLWKLSSVATPGEANAFGGGAEVPDLDPNWDDVEINEIASLNADDPGNPGFGDAVELHNTGSSPVSIEGWYQVDSGPATGAAPLSLADLKVWNGSALAAATDMVIPAGGYVAFSSKKGLSGEGDAVKVYGPGVDPAGRQLVDEQGYGDGQAGVSDSFESAARSYAACPDGSDAFVSVAVNSFGRANTASCETEVAPPLATTVVLNEVSNVSGKAELLNTGSAPVDLSGWELLDAGDAVVHTVPAGTSLAAGGFYVAEGIVGLDSVDSLTLRRPSDGARALGHTWNEDGIASYSRCELFGTVSYVETPTATWGAANACPGVVTEAWPGPAEITTVDEENGFGDGDGNGEGDVSGAAFDPADPSILWVVQNKNTLHKLRKVGGTYVAVDGWDGGKRLHFASGTGAVDSEGVTVGPDGSIYVTSERDNDNKNVSANKIERYDVSAVTPATTDLTAVDEWDVNSFVTTGANLGLEGITYLPDSFLVAAGWRANGSAYTAAAYPTPGLFVTAVEATGDLHFFSLAAGAQPIEVKVESSGFPFAMDTAFDPDRQALWALCDDTCGGVANLLKVEGGDFVVKRSLARPAGMPNLNNEGMAIKPLRTAVDNKVEVVWTDDGDTDGFSLREGHLRADFAVPAVVTPPTVTPPTVTPPTAAEQALAQAAAKVAATKEKVSSVKAKAKAAKKAKQSAKAKRLATKLKKLKKKLKKQKAALAQAVAAAKS